MALATSHWPPERLAAHQFRRFSALLHHAYRNVPFYRRHFDEAGFQPDRFRSLDDVSRVPMLTKSAVREASTMGLLAGGVNPERCQMVATSGSSGVPLRIFLDRSAQRSQRVCAWRILFEHDYRWRDRTLEIRMVAGDVHPVQRWGLAPKTWLSILESPEEWVKHLLAERPAVVVASASTLRALAEACPALQSPPRLIISDSEMLQPEDRGLIRSRLGTDPIDVYGLVELSNFAWQCEERRGFHVSADSHIVELIDGEVVVTDLCQLSMPMIRYRTGDHAAWSDVPCPCGRTLPVLARLDGRIADSVLLPSGRALFWPFFHEVLAVYPGLRQWRVIQRTDGTLRLQLATEGEEARRIARELSARLPEPLPIHCEAVTAIDRPPGEKFRALIRERKPG